MNKVIAVLLPAVLVVALASGAFGMMGLDVGAHAGYANYSAGDASNGGLDIGVNANLSVPLLFSFQIFAEYFTYSESTEGSDPAIETSFTDIPIGIHMMYAVSIPGSPIKPYVGAGPSIHIMSSEVTGLGVTDGDESSTEFGIGGVGGVEYKFMPKLALFFELRDHYIFTSETVEISPGVEMETENTNALYVLGGVRLSLP
jgi:opacity protein-like surface antigen